MRLRDLAAGTTASPDLLLRCAAWTRTQEFSRRLDESRRAVDLWLALCSRPVVSVSGGKDSTATLALVRAARPDVTAIRADPPNGYPDRADHCARLETASGGPWVAVPYLWDVASVLDGRARYPAGLKVRRVREAFAALGADGLAFGVRAAESSARRAHVAARGLVYQRADGVRVCQPVALWSAEEVIGYLLAADELPLSPVYRRTHLMPQASLERLRDGTWWPHTDPASHRPWLALHYIEVLADYDRACAVGAARREDGML